MAIVAGALLLVTIIFQLALTFGAPWGLSVLSALFTAGTLVISISGSKSERLPAPVSPILFDMFGNSGL